MKNIRKIWLWLRKHWSFLALLLFIGIVVFLASRKPEIIIKTKDNPRTLAELRQIKDENGKLHSIIEQKTISEAHKDVIIDTLAKALHLKPKEIKGEDVYVLRTDTVFKTTTKYVDSTKDKPYYTTTYKDRWLEIKAVAGRDTSNITFKQYDTIHRVEIVKNPLIGRTKREIRIYNDNPHSKLTHGYSWTVKEASTYLSVGPSIQYNPFTKKLDVGISVQVPIIKFKRK